LTRVKTAPRLRGESGVHATRHFEEHAMSHVDFNRAAPWALALGGGASQAFAHPGHADAPAMGVLQALQHLLTQPDHLAVLALGAGVAAWALRAWRQQRARTRAR
jgi:hydrogenase/urease accessory protein HupE